MTIAVLILLFLGWFPVNTTIVKCCSRTRFAGIGPSPRCLVRTNERTKTKWQSWRPAFPILATWRLTPRFEGRKGRSIEFRIFGFVTVQIEIFRLKDYESDSIEHLGRYVPAVLWFALPTGVLVFTAVL